MTLEKYNIPIDDLRQWLRYDAGTGYLWWVKNPGGRARMDIPAGCLRKADGRIQVKVLKKLFKAHLAYCRAADGYFGEFKRYG